MKKVTNNLSVERILVVTELPTNCVTFFREALSIPSRFLVT